MSLFGALDASASGLTAQRVWLNLIANNLANVDSTVTPGGGPYRQEEPVFAERPYGRGVSVVGIWQDPTPGPLYRDPGNPAADAAGYVQGSNVNQVSQMVDLVTATRSYEANATVLGDEKTLFQKALSLIE